MTLLGKKPLMFAALMTLALTGCATDNKTTTTESGAKIVDKGKLTVCSHLPYKPFEFNKSGDAIGFDIDLLDLVAKELDLKTVIFDTPFEGIQSGQALNTAKCDVAAAGMTITEARAKVMDFSDPYFSATQALLVKKGSGIASLEDLAGKSLAVQESTTGELYAQEHAPEDTELRSFEDFTLLEAAVKTGKVDAAVNDNGVLYDYVKTNPDLEVPTEFDTGEQYGFAVRKDGNDALLKTINEVFAKSKTDGSYDGIYKKWFGDAPKS
jgi:polar amino acid transport system substrate-binding protein